MGLDMGRRRALGFCAIPLWTMGSCGGRRLGLGAWAPSGCWRRLRSAGLCARACRVRWRRGDSGVHRTRRSRRSRCGLVSFGSARRVGAPLPHERSLHVERQHNEFPSDQPNGSHECLQHHGRQSDYECEREQDLHVPELARRGYRRFEDCISEWRASRQGCGPSQPSGNSARTGGTGRGSRSHAASRRGAKCPGESVGASSCYACE